MKPTSVRRRLLIVKRFVIIVEQEGKFVRQTGGRGKFGHVWLRLEPLDPAGETEYEFAEEVVGGTVPKEFHGVVDKGIQERMKNGVLAGYPVVGVKATLYDGSYHDVDSDELSFKMAGSMAFRKVSWQRIQRYLSQ